MTRPIGSDSTFRDSFLEGAARAFFVTAYADHVENCDDFDDDHDYAKPGPGGDWCDSAPEAPPNAYALAGELWAKLAAANPDGAGVYTLADLAAEADGKAIDAESFGHYLAMQAMGHGVSWFDDHKRFPMVIPHMECSMCSFDTAAYRGQ
jgi:hypothetical protein